MITSNDLYAAHMNQAFPDSTVQLWDKNVTNEYIIAYELDPKLDQKLKNMLPKVCFRLNNKKLYVIDRTLGCLCE